MKTPKPIAAGPCKMNSDGTQNNNSLDWMIFDGQALKKQLRMGPTDLPKTHENSMLRVSP